MSNTSPQESAIGVGNPFHFFCGEGDCAGVGSVAFIVDGLVVDHSFIVVGGLVVGFASIGIPIMKLCGKFVRGDRKGAVRERSRRLQGKC